MEKADAKNFDDITKQGRTVVDFWAEWCGPCKMLNPVLEELSGEITEIKFVKLNVDENQDIASQSGVRGIPTLILYNKGEEIDRIVGFLPKDALKKRIEASFQLK